MNDRSADASLEALRLQAVNAPVEPGVYLMRDAAQVVIYVGKAKSLRNRLKTYFTGGDGRYQIEFLLRRVVAFETIVTQSEEQAFLLERDLIGKYKPRYNIRLKDDKSYLSIRIDERAEWPRLELVRRTENDGATYYGPFAFSGELRNLLEVIRKVIPLRTCSDSVLYNRQRPCMEYQIKRCCAPCCLSVSPSDYRDLLKQAIGIIEGKTGGTIKLMSAKMETAADALKFEEAAAWRDRIEVLEGFQAGHSLITFRGENRDVFGLIRDSTTAAVCILLVRNGRIAESKPFIFDDVQVADQELIEGVIQQFYEGGREIPCEIVVPMELDNASLLEAGLTVRRGRKVSLVHAQRGSKARLLDMAQLNARHAFVGSQTKESEWDIVADALRETLGLRQSPRRVECVDISNFQGSDTVGAIVTFFDGVADKASYRRYNLSHYHSPNDFASVYDVVLRRLKRGAAENSLPDLLVIDGGAGQLSMALQARDELGLAIEVVALAKMRTESEVFATDITRKPERLYIPGRAEPLLLDEGRPLTRFLSRIRDEVHRYVITFHRDKRAKRVFKTRLDGVSGLSSEMRSRLLRRFKTVDAIGEAAAEDIAAIGRMPLALARKVSRALGGG
ncbi:MAG: excinuclease ABC subunit UvrC [Pseudomonadota bacterium]|jgi:excinuclease ABC subunit C